MSGFNGLNPHGLLTLTRLESAVRRQRILADRLLCSDPEIAYGYLRKTCSYARPAVN